VVEQVAGVGVGRMATPRSDESVKRFVVVVFQVTLDLALGADDGAFAQQLVTRPDAKAKEIDSA